MANDPNSTYQVEYSTSFLAYMDTLPERVAAALEIVGGRIEDYAKNLCPVGSGIIYTSPEDTGTQYIGGTLRDSITHHMEEGSDDTMIVGTNVKYAPWVELGHNQEPGRFVPAIRKRLVASHVAGQPFLRPALENHMDEYREIIERVLDPTVPPSKPGGGSR